MAPRGSVGRPPGPHDDTLAKILPTALRLFLEEGGAALTPTRLHQETGVSRATIYRNFPEPADLIEIMLARATELPPDDCWTGDLPADLHRAVETLRFRFEHRPARAFFAATLEYGRTSPQVAETSERFVAGILEPIRRVVAAAVDAGELSGDVDDLVSEVAGPLMLEHVIQGRSVSERRAREVVDSFLRHHNVTA